jgi:hypothetical protein
MKHCYFFKEDIMKIHRMVQVIGLAGLLVLLGCIPSLHPLYTEKDITFNQDLVGTWEVKDSKDTLTFTKKGEKAYKLVTEDSYGKKGKFTAYLVKVGDLLFLDFYPIKSDAIKNDTYESNLVQAHTFMKVNQIEPELKMAMMQPDWIKQYLKDNPEALKHEKVEDRIILTAQPGELQAFLMKHVKTTDAWLEFDPTKKVQEQEQKPKEAEQI